jgi:hypothetical protein
MRIASTIVLLLLPIAGRGEDLSVRARQAVEAALPGILRGSANYPKHRSCFSCHHQAQPLMTLASANACRFNIDPTRSGASWSSVSNLLAKVVQPFFDNGDPGGKSQFISFSATNWAVLALLEAIPPVPDRNNSRLTPSRKGLAP